AYPEFDSCFDDDMGSVLHVPAGTAVVERDKDSWSWNDIEDYQEMVGRFPEGPLLLTEDVSLPYHWLVDLPAEPWAAALPGHPRSEELVEVWDDSRDGSIWGTLQLGGYANEEVVETDPVARAVREALRAVTSGRIDWPVSGDVADWVLLVDWHLDVDGWEGASFHWSIQREDLAARRFDRTITTVFWNP
ncbi:MAG: hypothetical protein ABWY11_05010, partial [Umezawaea sp.]